ncbi:MAG: LysM domain-containing protein [Thermodesulfobacteriota bacterium]
MRRPSGSFWAVTVLGILLLLPAGAFAQSEAAPAQEAIPPNGIVHTVVEGDTLWDLSAKYLGTPWKWTEIWERNRFLSNPHYIYPGIRIVIVPSGPREAALLVEPPPAAPPAPAEPPSAPAPTPAPEPAPAPVAVEKFLDIQPETFVGAGEFLREKPRGIGRILGGREPKMGFAQNDTIYLSMDKEVSKGQLLGVYRIRGPIGVSGRNVRSGYVKYLIGILQVGPVEDGRLTARVRKSFEDLTREDMVSDEIPSFARVKIVPGDEGLQTTILTGRLLNEEMATGDFVFFDGGADSGMAVGNVFRVLAPTGIATGTPMAGRGDVKSEVARAVVIRVGGEFSTAYVVDSTQSFMAGVLATRGIPAQ